MRYAFCNRSSCMFVSFHDDEDSDDDASDDEIDESVVSIIFSCFL